jgi:TfoX/Sxy family transcriptional regulator of competence genes
MSYDEELANRVREQLAAHEGVAEKTMFGSLGFMVRGNLAVCARRDGELLVRVGPDGMEDALADPQARRFEMGSRSMKGWVLVGAPALESDSGLRDWVERGARFAESLPGKG